ncbi:MAG: NnrS family protein [Flavobacteriales bacterium]|nr:NnrS family protein [Flavobacteriales bacterium]
MSINVDNNQTALAILPILRLAFRPLFLGGTLFSVIAIAWWIHFWLKPTQWMPYGGPIWWHGHEMLFGFGVAIVTGFLLTAVKTWTGVAGLRGKLLGAFVSIWLLGRILISFGNGLDGWIIASVDVAYLIFAAIAMAYPVVKVKQWRNLMFVPILLILASLNATSHWAVLSNDPLLATKTLHATIILFTLIIAILGGRVIPALTANGTGKPKLPAINLLEITSIVSILFLVAIALIGFNQVDSKFLLNVSIIAAAANGLRFLRWGIQHTWTIPLLWSLHLSFIFIPSGFILLALYAAGLMDNLSAALHSFTVGAIGGMILAMISRVTLGHTGRPLKPHSLISVAYIFILLSAVVRVALPAWMPEMYSLSIGLAGVLWILAYAVYLFFYTPMLVTTRADGRPG